VLARLLERDYGYKMDIYNPFYAPGPVCEKNKYSLITCTEVVEHVKKPPELFEALAARLAPEGILSIMTMFQRPRALSGLVLQPRPHTCHFLLRLKQYAASRPCPG
jgi:2-polyprenyl-3-methyl-5-hydroxy-6-metoxy-1,4-benzoquinol methylase